MRRGWAGGGHGGAVEDEHPQHVVLGDAALAQGFGVVPQLPPLVEQALIGGRHVGVTVDGGFQVGDGQFVTDVDGQDIVVDDAMAGGDGDGDLPAPRVNSSSSPATVHPGGRGTADMMDLVERFVCIFFLVCTFGRI